MKLLSVIFGLFCLLSLVVANTNDFYVSTGGAMLNAGSTTNSVAIATSTGGDYGNAAANRFTAASGTPFASCTSGMWATVYLDAAKVASNISLIVAVNASGASIDFSTTEKYGTMPSTGASGRSCKVGGAWSSLFEAPLAIGSGAIYSTTRCNVQKGTYTHTTTNVTLNCTGNTTNLMIWRGYDTTPGDCDEDQTKSRPLILFTTARAIISGANNFFNNMVVVSGITANWALTTQSAGLPIHIDRLTVSNTTANATSKGAQFGISTIMRRSHIVVTSTSTNCFTASGSVGSQIYSTTFEGGSVDVSTSNDIMEDCIFLNQISHAIILGGGNYVMFKNLSIYNSGGDAIRVNGASIPFATIANCLVDTANGWFCNNNSGQILGNFTFYNNDTKSCSSGVLSGFGDLTNVKPFTESVSPFTNAGAGDLSLTSTCNAKGNAAPGQFQDSSVTSYGDIGAVQRQEPSGGSGGGPLTGGRLAQ